MRISSLGVLLSTAVVTALGVGGVSCRAANGRRALLFPSARARRRTRWFVQLAGKPRSGARLPARPRSRLKSRRSVPPPRRPASTFKERFAYDTLWNGFSVQVDGANLAALRSRAWRQGRVSRSSASTRPPRSATDGESRARPGDGGNPDGRGSRALAARPDRQGHQGRRSSTPASTTTTPTSAAASARATRSPMATTSSATATTPAARPATHWSRSPDDDPDDCARPRLARLRHRRRQGRFRRRRDGRRAGRHPRCVSRLRLHRQLQLGRDHRRPRARLRRWHAGRQPEPWRRLPVARVPDRAGRRQAGRRRCRGRGVGWQQRCHRQSGRLARPGVGTDVIGVASFDNTSMTQVAFSISPDDRKIGFGAATAAPLPPTSGTSPMARTGTQASAADGCAALPAGSLAGTVALIRRGTCGFYNKAYNAQSGRCDRRRALQQPARRR